MVKKFDDFHNFQKARSNCFRSFEKRYELSKDIEGSIQKALETADVNKSILKLNPNFYKGLKGEIIFYGKTFKSLDLDVLMDSKKVPADFHSPTTNKYYDVTTNLNYKDVDKYIKNDNREYMLAFVDINSEEIELIPTSFPTCPICGNYSHYIYFLDDTNKTEIESSIDYPDQDLVNYCFCGYYKEIDHSNYYLFSPKTYFDDEYPEGVDDELEASKFLNDKWTEISNLARKEFDVFISAVTCLEEKMMKSKDDFWTFEKPKWIHPLLDLEKNNHRKFYFPSHEIVANY